MFVSFVYACVHACVSLLIMHACCIFVCVFMHACVYAGVCVCVCVCLRVYACVYACTRMYLVLPWSDDPVKSTPDTAIVQVRNSNISWMNSILPMDLKFRTVKCAGNLSNKYFCNLRLFNEMIVEFAVKTAKKSEIHNWDTLLASLPTFMLAKICRRHETAVDDMSASRLCPASRTTCTWAEHDQG